MNNKEAHDAPHRFPQQIEHPKAHHHIGLTVERTGGTGKGAVLGGQGLESGLLAVEARSAFAGVSNFRFPDPR